MTDTLWVKMKLYQTNGKFHYTPPEILAKSREYAAAHRDEAAKRREERKKTLVAEHGGCCMDCGGVFPICCYDFDHRDPKTKKSLVSQLGKIEKARAEAAKCDLVCSNCHRIRTQKRANGEPINARTHERFSSDSNTYSNPFDLIADALAYTSRVLNPDTRVA